MRRIQALLLLLILVAAPFLAVPTVHLCGMQPDAPQAACCCGHTSDDDAGCCTLIPVPPGEPLAAVAPLVPAPDLVGLMLPPLPESEFGLDEHQHVASIEHAPPRAPARPLFLLHSSLLS